MSVQQSEKNNYKENLLVLFEKTFSNANQLERDLAETSIKILKDADLILFMQSLFDIISLKTKGLDNSKKIKDVQKAVAVYIKKIIEDFLDNIESNANDNYIYFDLIMKGIFNENIKTNNKIQFQIILHKLLINDMSNSLKNDLLNVIKKNFSQLMALTPNEIKGTLYLIRSVLGSLNTTIDINTFFNDINENLFFLAKNLIEFFSNKNFDYLLLMKSLKVLKVWVETFKNFITKLTDLNCEKTNSIANIILSHNTGEILFNILKLSFPFNNQLEDCIISTAVQEDFNNLLNDIKSKSFRCYNILLEYILENKEINLKDCKIYEYSFSLIEYVFGSLIKIYAIPQFATIKEKKNYKNIILESIQFLRISCLEIKNNSFFNKNYEIIFFYIILPQLIYTNEEILDFSENCEKFENFVLDICEKNIVDSIKTSVSLLLKVMAHSIDGFTTFLFNFCKDCISFSILSNNIDEIDTIYQNLKLIKIGYYDLVNEFTPEFRMQTSFLIMSIINKELIIRKDLLKNIECLFINFEEILLSKNLSNLVKAHLFLLFGFIGNYIFKKEKRNLFYKYLKKAVNNVKSKKNKTVSLSLIAIDTVLKIIQNEKVKKKESVVILDIFKILSNKIKKIKYPQYFETIEFMIKKFRMILIYNNIELLNLFKNLIEIIIQNVNKNKKTKKPKGIIVPKLFNLTIEIINLKSIQLIPEYEETLISLMNLFQPGKKLNYDNKCFNLFSDFILKTQIISPTLETSIPFIIQYFIINHINVFSVFSPVLSILKYGKDFIMKNNLILENIIEIGLSYLSPNINIENEDTQALGAVILQSVILNYGNNLNFEHWNTIFTKLILRLNSKIENKFLKGSFNGIFLSSFYVKFNLMQELFVKIDKLNYVIQLLLTESDVYFSTYDKKLFILTICKIYENESINEIFINNSPKIFDFSLSILKKLEEENSNKKKKKSHDDIIEENEEENKSFDSLDDLNDEFCEENYDHFNQCEMTYKEFMKSFNILNNIDEFIIFRNFIYQLKQKNHVFLQNIFNNLAESKQEILKQIIQNQRVLINEKENISVTRKIVKVKGLKKF